ncbi:biosynthetic-type acetolactate synthase large subunit [Deinococcus radiodurans R1 = ATCC 13939 = DSM 20539]|uniref:Acetolactate synthase n=2 Tax=Deinococcus radiodurans TaxID=1299 RepID=Q9RU76_DEIRA|nr:acetolactate synthase, large subunit [Deinococcus radiodurans R1 = ATCC 13939 = DSM 20539]QEM70960.1 biosynthetic-type acetolactate synthase large subunit [Deinococcus radiodurans]ANC71357.1 acetolactate synthase catalytic subunit [Deinococcus radiodurans R1 = ATCC 13939 = DSM 20539]UDL00614.1 biosynthetic-type acetolactate synthase large subunit [Deinococcus radiodurans R1 = ATCC 13939 = DSM 20539]UID70494.1 acetolactate synthase catalytic subunit [Deinococcus radiodurans R1 = ATCC 13939 = 
MEQTGKQGQNRGEMTGAKALWATLAGHGITTVFGYPGGAIMPVYDALTFYPEVRHILARHEQGAIHAAEGWAKATGEIGVCMATSGPGATNLVTGLADAMLDSVPLLAITGNVAQHLMGTDAFQEADITGITMPITKHNYVVRDVDELPRVIAEAIRIARSGRPGPVLVDIPKDVQLAAFAGDIPTPHTRPQAPEASAESIASARELLRNAKKPVLVMGGGSLDASAELTALAHAWGLPVITTLMGLGAYPASDPLWLGMPGMHGSVAANRAISECDVLLAVGMRFDDRVTGRVSGFAPHAQIIHVELDAAEIGKIVRTHLPIRSDAKTAARQLAEGAEKLELGEWLSQIEEWKGRAVPPQQWGAAYAVGQVTARLRPDDILSSDVGQHQMLAAQLARFEKPRRWLNSGGLGTMGFGFPAAIGAALAEPGVVSMVVAGDGGFQMTAQELATLKMYDIRNVKICIINNSYLGMVRQWQELFHGKRYSEVWLGDSNPDFVKLAGAYDVPAYRASSAEELPAAIDAWLSDPKSSLLEVVVPHEHGVFPMVPAGAALHEMMETEPVRTDISAEATEVNEATWQEMTEQEAEEMNQG